MRWVGRWRPGKGTCLIHPLPICKLRAVCRRALCQLSDLPVLPALYCLLLGSGCCQGMSVVWLLSEKSQGYLRLPPTASAFILHPSLHHSHCNLSSEDNILPWAQTASYSGSSCFYLPNTHFTMPNYTVTFPLELLEGLSDEALPPYSPIWYFYRYQIMPFFLFCNPPPWPPSAGKIHFTL